MKITDRLYWFFRNLSAFILLLVFSPFYWVINLTIALIKVLIVTDGSSIIAYPWEWNWRHE